MHRSRGVRLLAVLVPCCLAGQVNSDRTPSELLTADVSLDSAQNSAVVTFTNKSNADITAFATTLTVAGDSSKADKVPYFIDFLPAIASAAIYPGTEGAHGLRPGAFYRTTMPLPPGHTLSADISVDVLAVIFMDRSAVGDSAAVDKLLEGRRMESAGFCSAATVVEQALLSDNIVAAVRDTARELKSSAIANRLGTATERELARGFHDQVATTLTRLSDRGARASADLKQYATYLRTRCSLTTEHSKKGGTQ